jgi:hypothetical protein
MNEHTTPSILQRVPLILAVTAASYGLPAQGQGHSLKDRPGQAMSSAAASPCCCPEEPRDNVAIQH